MNAEEMVQLCKRHTMYTWSSQAGVTPLPIARAEGIHFWTPDGKRYIDFNSQLMSVNVGHGHPKVREAIKRQVDELTFVFPGSATAPRARLGKLLSEIVPDPINTFFFTLGGAEANENAIRAARLYTGRHKIITRYRSYHGGTNATMQLTGDPRRWANEPGMPGIVRVMDPEPYTFSFGDDDATKTARNLEYLEEVLMYEGPQNVAAIFIESVTGTNGILPPPAGYLSGLRALCDRYGILLVTDEVMAGFGRTGKLLAFMHYDVVPDIVTMAKGLTSSYLPLGAMGVSDAIAKHFQDNVFWGGLTYNSHPMLLAAAEANIRVLLDEGMIDNAARLEPVVREEMERLTAKHPSVKGGRCIGLFGMMDLQKNSAGEPMAPYNATSPAMQALKEAFDDKGLFTFVRWGSFMCNPPLCITEAQLRQAYAIVDECLDVTDAYFEG
ncbi:MAG: aspartate aminotransferase family protein [Proteobacteria bacterium]|nr:MAG: aspartate aminotransferase family protein [Pseudomonadota bacterium]